ncbi:MAG: DNA polymerase III subunit alpha, partial [Chloroflexi bacterium]|nr:DNA polymerase III subunit alpha [Chloroflexota bacterium]
SSGMRRTLRDMQPTEFNDIVALLSLYRPGPMQFIPDYINRKFGRERVTYRHPSLEPILAETYGIIVYQEQIIRIASELAGYSPGEADLMRRAVGKKKKKDLEEQHSRFVEGAVARGLPREAAEAIFADIELFADYGFNKSHSAAYAVITVQTAYLKAHYPVEFLTALLSVDRNNQEKVALFVGECRRLGIPVRGPDVNRSDVDFIIEPADEEELRRGVDVSQTENLAIRFGLGAIKNVGDGPAALIVEARGDKPFADLEDLAGRVDLRQVNKRVLECLIRAGALDSLGERRALLEAIDAMMGISQDLHRARDVGQRSLFELQPELMGNGVGATFSLPEVEPMTEKQRLADEKELLGTYVSAHPLEVLSVYVDDRLTPLSEIDATLDGQTVQVAGLLTSVRTITTKKGDLMAFAQFEDLSGVMEMVIFPRTYDLARAMLTEDNVVLVEAKVDAKRSNAASSSAEEPPQLIAEAIELYRLPQNARRRRTGGASKVTRLCVEITLDGDDERSAQLVDDLFELLLDPKGTVPFSFRLQAPGGQVELAFPDRATAYSPQLESRLREVARTAQVALRWA